jgi:CheY-like chemotaxis protein
MRDLYLHYLCDGDREPGGDAGIAVTHLPFVLGRHPDCDHCLSDPWVSRRHCALSERDGGVWVADLGSRHGTYLNGQRLAEARPVRDGDRLALARVPFQVHLAAAPAPSNRVAGMLESRGPSHNVLVVEDDADVAEPLALLLRRWGHEVHVARDGVEALRAARAYQPDTVLLDLRLPRMDGYQVARWLRAQAALEKTLVVAITGYEPGKGERSPEDVGIDRVLGKPMDPAVLREVLGAPG